MRSIHSVVETILIRDADIKEKISEGLINLSAYAKRIQRDVETRAMKPASVESITVSLSRIQQSLGQTRKNSAPTVVSRLSIQSPIVEHVYEKSPDALLSLGKTMKLLGSISPDNYFSFSTSTRDIAIVMSESIEKDIANLFTKKPRVKKKDLVALSIRFPETAVSEPNIGTKFMQAIGARGIVLDEVVSTYNEFTIVCNKKYLDDALDVLHAFQKYNKRPGGRLYFDFFTVDTCS